MYICRMKLISHIFTVIATSLLLSSALCGCRSKECVPESEEETLFLLVNQPCGEGDYKTAVQRADSILTSPRELGDSLRAYIMIERGVALAEMGEHDWALAYADTLTEFGRKSGMALAEMQGLQSHGVLSRRNGDLERAVADYEAGLDIAVKSADAEMEQVFCELLAVACAQADMLDEAEEFAVRASEMAKEDSDPEGQLNASATLAAILVKKKDFVGAVALLQPLRTEAEGVRPLLKVKYLTPLLKSYLSLDSLQQAKATLASMYAALENTDRHTQAWLQAVNAESAIAEKEGRYADQWRWLVEADSIGRMGTSPDEWLQERAQCLYNLGRYREAYDYQKLACAAMDSVRVAEGDARLAELSVKYDTLSKDADLQRLKAERFFIWMVGLACVLLLAVLLAAGIWLHLRTKRRMEREKHAKYLLGLEQERQRMARELHDDIAGSLVAFQWQLRTSAPDAAERELLRIAGRVRTLSHELMPPEFERGQLTPMLRDYIFALNATLADRQVMVADSGGHKWDTLKPETAHEIYRMVQEAIRNAVSHGLPGQINVAFTVRGDVSEIRIDNPTAETQAEPQGKGLQSLRARAEIAGAEVEVAKKDGIFTIIIRKFL